jgi:hypothetical protein
MPIYTIVFIIITLAYSSAKILNVASYFFQYKDRIISQKPDSYIINEFGLCIFKNILKAGLFVLGVHWLNNSIITGDWPTIIVLGTTFALLVPMDLVS